MSQLQDLTRCLLAAGGGPHPEGKGFVLLYTDQSSLISKVWTGSSFGDQELIDTDVRANAPAPYLLMPTTCIILSISDSSKLVSFRYDVEEEEWVPDDIPDHVVHADGKLAAATDVDGHVSVFYQSVEERLVHLDEAWKPTLLPVQPVIGTPLTTLLSDDRVHVFYISAGDRCLHYIVRDSSGCRVRLDRTE
ncbi:uncharacterized protein LAESUDRAFT_258324 [Laetiporus sulphureus 93-53]|uniref:Fucose-specific lectin n=1 Tax=Laetiporus sulphureus 93-53 TaxID=1314785 RepID=A0A165H420_9APHY|nr:uncharacterized protein LAESUDRAFT_258324 [Laetiporus sulphureus 93-53]KZT11213.1 hypothetical protein LAESUDRAFT_258324 [Laetiporus sulphureus 93-53]